MSVRVVQIEAEGKRCHLFIEALKNNEPKNLPPLMSLSFEDVENRDDVSISSELEPAAPAPASVPPPLSAPLLLNCSGTFVCVCVTFMGKDVDKTLSFQNNRKREELYLNELCHGGGQRQSGLVHRHQSVLAAVEDAHLMRLALLLRLFRKRVRNHMVTRYLFSLARGGQMERAKGSGKQHLTTTRGPQFRARNVPVGDAGRPGRP